MKNHKKEIVVMHPGPINRGVEISSEIVNSNPISFKDDLLLKADAMS